MRVAAEKTGRSSRKIEKPSKKRELNQICDFRSIALKFISDPVGRACNCNLLKVQCPFAPKK